MCLLLSDKEQRHHWPRVRTYWRLLSPADTISPPPPYFSHITAVGPTSGLSWVKPWRYLVWGHSGNMKSNSGVPVSQPWWYILSILTTHTTTGRLLLLNGVLHGAPWLTWEPSQPQLCAFQAAGKCIIVGCHAKANSENAYLKSKHLQLFAFAWAYTL